MYNIVQVFWSAMFRISTYVCIILRDSQVCLRSAAYTVYIAKLGLL